MVQLTLVGYFLVVVDVDGGDVGVDDGCDFVDDYYFGVDGDFDGVDDGDVDDLHFHEQRFHEPP